MIAKYVIEEYKNTHTLYGFGNQNRDYNYKYITKFYFDIKNIEKLEYYLEIIKPDIIIHLASISSAIEAFAKPIIALQLNGMITAHICDIIYKNKWNTKLFNASSSEIFKGHIDYNVTENDHNMYHCHPYSIAKIMGHSIIEFYRNTYNLPFSNGIFFTIESKHKKGDFLLRKIANHSKQWLQDFEPIKLGSLDSYRTILHGSDAAKAVKLILDQDIGDTYIICGEGNIKIIDLVLRVYKLRGIIIDKIENNILYSNDKIVVIIENINKGIDTKPVNIRGESTKLKKLGWNINYSIDDIVNEILEN